MVRQQIATEIQYNWIHTIRKLLFARTARKHKTRMMLMKAKVGRGSQNCGNNTRCCPDKGGALAGVGGGGGIVRGLYGDSRGETPGCREKRFRIRTLIRRSCWCLCLRLRPRPERCLPLRLCPCPLLFCRLLPAAPGACGIRGASSDYYRPHRPTVSNTFTDGPLQLWRDPSWRWPRPSASVNPPPLVRCPPPPPFVIATPKYQINTVPTPTVPWTRP